MGLMDTAPLAGVRVVEVALGVSAVGAGMAASLPGALSSLGPRFLPTFNPLSLPAELARASGAGWAALVSGLMVLSAFLCSTLAVLACARLVRAGLFSTTGPLQGPRAALPAGARRRPSDRRPLVRGALGKDLRLLLRDRNFLAQTLLIPLLVVGVQLVMNRSNSKAKLDNKEIESALKMEISASVPSDAAVPNSVNEGRPIVETDPKGKVAKGFEGVAELIAGKIPEGTSKGGLFGRK